MNAQIIEKDGKPEWAVIPYDQYQLFLEAVEMLADIRAFDEAKQRIAAGEEVVPGEVTYAILDGANPIRVWREHRGLTQKQLAENAGISNAYLSQLESGKRGGTADVLLAIAQALQLTVEDIVS